MNATMTGQPLVRRGVGAWGAMGRPLHITLPPRHTPIDRISLQVVDNTIRDGGLINNWKFSDDFVKAIYEACVAAGVDYMDVGYFSTPGTYTDAGPWRHLDDSNLRRVMGDNKTSLKLSAMVDVGRITADDIPHSNDTLIDMVRVAFYDDQVDEAVKIANACNDKGFEVGLLFMALSSINKVLSMHTHVRARTHTLDVC